MIRRMKGVLESVEDGVAVVDVGGIGYEIILPPIVAGSLQGKEGDVVTIITRHYLYGDGHTFQPVLIGFLREQDREFYDLLANVPRLGPTRAARALARPVSEIARAIELGDHRFLQGLPGIGKRVAAEMVTNLRGNIGTFIEAEEMEELQAVRTGTALEQAALEVLSARLGYSQSRAATLIQAALERRPDVQTVEDLIREALKR